MLGASKSNPTTHQPFQSLSMLFAVQGSIELKQKLMPTHAASTAFLRLGRKTRKARRAAAAGDVGTAPARHHHHHHHYEHFARQGYAKTQRPNTASTVLRNFASTNTKTVKSSPECRSCKVLVPLRSVDFRCSRKGEGSKKNYLRDQKKTISQGSKKTIHRSKKTIYFLRQ